MGFLHKLWDETLAGPAPDSGLGRLRKFDLFSTLQSPSHGVNDRTLSVSRAITILRPKNLSIEPGSGQSSPAPSSGPSSPFSPGTPRDEDVKRFTRKKKKLEAMEHADQALSPTAMEWIMISALDR